MTETEQDRSSRQQGAITDRFWKTLSGTLKSVGTDDRVRAAMSSVVGEESLKAVVQNLIPKDAAQSIKSSLDEFLNGLQSELLSFLSQRADRLFEDFDLRSEFAKFLSENKVEIHATISLKAKGSDTEVADSRSKQNSAPEENAEPTKAEAKKVVRTKRTKSPKKATSQKTPSRTKTKKITLYEKIFTVLLGYFLFPLIIKFPLSSRATVATSSISNLLCSSA